MTKIYVQLWKNEIFEDNINLSRKVSIRLIEVNMTQSPHFEAVFCRLLPKE